MLYDEFLVGTGCRDTEYNFQVYKDLEILYMNSDKSKEEIYEYGKKLVDNSLTEKQVAWNAEIDDEIARQKKYLESFKKDLEYYEQAYDYWKISDKEYAKQCKRSAKWAREQMTIIRNKIRNLKSCKYV